jgi:hypothetical protein
MTEIEWKNARYWELEILKAMQVLFASDPNLLAMVFDPEKPELRAPAEKILSQARRLSCGEVILVRMALELWNGSGELTLLMLLEQLDHRNFGNAIQAMLMLGPKPPRLKVPQKKLHREADPAWSGVLF